MASLSESSLCLFFASNHLLSGRMPTNVMRESCSKCDANVTAQVESPANSDYI